MSNGTTADLSAGVTANLTCGSISGNVTADPNGTAAVCTINGTTGTLTDATTGAAITVTGSGTAAISGNSDNLTLGSANLNVNDDATGLTVGDAAGVSGGAITLAASNLTGLTVNAKDVTVSDGSGVTGGALTFNGSIGNWNTFGGTGGTITIGQHIDANILGGNSVNVASGSGVSLYGGVDSVSASNSAVNINANTQANLTGGGLSVYDAASSASATLGTGSTGDTFTGTGGTINLGVSNLTGLTVNATGATVQDGSGVTGGVITFNDSAGNWDTFGGTGGTITVGQNTDANILGGNTLNAAAGSIVSLYSGIDNVSASNSSVSINANTQANLTGGGLIVYDAASTAVADLGAGSTGDTFTGNGGTINLGVSNLTGLTIDATGATVSDGSGVTGGALTFNGSIGSWDTFGGTGGTITIGQHTDANILGGNSISVASGSGVSLYGGVDSVSASNGAVNINANTQANLTGGGLSVYDAASSAAATLGTGSIGDTFTGNGGTITLGVANLTGLTVNATGATVQDGSGVTGGAVTFNGSASNWDTFNGSGGTITVGQNTDANILGGNTLNAGSGSIVSLYGGVDNVSASNSAVNINANTQADLTGGGLSIYDAASSAAATLGTGSTGDTFTGTGGAITLGVGNLNLTDKASGITIGDASGVSSGDLTLGAGNLTLTDNASGLTVQDGSGVTGGTINVANNIGSAEFLGSGLTIDAGTGDDTGAIQVGGTTGTDIVNWAGRDNVGADSWSVNFNPLSSITDTITDWAGLNATGSMDDQLTNWSASGGGGSQLDWYNPDTDISSILGNFTQSNENGNLTTEDIFATSGNEEKLTLDYNGSDQFTGYVDDYYNSSGSFLGDADYNSTGQETSQSGTVGDYGYYIGGYDLASVVSAKSSKGKNISQIAAYDLNHGQLGAASSAEGAFFQAQLTALAPTTAGVLAPTTTAAKWANGVITWSFGTGSGTTANPFSSAIGTQYQSLVENAFAAWAAATGLKFQQVASSAPSDIAIGFGDFNTAGSSVLGYTSSPTQGGQLTAGAIIRLEDPSQTALTTDANGQLAYSGTNAELEQVILHEIGHAIGLGDSSTPTSIMYSVANAQDTTISASDIAAFQSLYGTASNSAATIGALSSAANTNSSASSSAAVSQFIQSMATFDVSPVGLTSGPIGQVNVSSTPLLAVSHAA